MCRYIWRSAFVWAIVAGGPALGAVPNEITHRGVIAVHGERFTGEGDFRFALVDRDTDAYLWVNDGSGVAGPDPPTNPVTLTVVNGIYNVRLGDTDLANMTAIPRAVFNDDNVVLRIWFDDGANGVYQLSPDQVLTSVPYAQRLPNVFVDEATGNVGIGTSTPRNKLDVEGGAVVGASYAGARAGPDNGLLVEGNVGVGTTGPQNRLDVEGGAVVGSSYAGTTMAPADSLLVEGRIGIGTSNPQNKLDVEGGAVVGYSYSGTETAPSNGLLVEGNVGIGTTAPMEKLDVVGTTRTSRIEVTEASGFGLVPPGAIMPFAGATPPTGWLVCDGTAYDKDDPAYAALHAAIGTAWGDGTSDTNPDTDFNVPDLRGRFLRGVANGSALDPDRSTRTESKLGGNRGDNVGSVQGDAYKQHSHGVIDEGHGHDLTKFNIANSEHALSWEGDRRYSAGSYDTFGARVVHKEAPLIRAETATCGIEIEYSPPGEGEGAETRPVNAYVNYIIKY